MSVTGASGRAECSMFSVFYWYVADFMLDREALAQVEKCTSCCYQISIAENYIVFDAKLARLNHMRKKQNKIIVHAFSSKANFESQLKTYLVMLKTLLSKKTKW